MTIATKLQDGWDCNYRNIEEGRSAWSDDPQPFIARALSSIPPRSAVVDLGAGDGRNTRFLIERGHFVTALDISETGLRLLVQRYKNAGVQYLTPIIGTLDALPFISQYFDAALAADVLPQIDNVRTALEEIHRILKPSGLFFVDVFTPRDCAFGEGTEIAPRRFAYKETLFTFFEVGDLELACEGLFDVISVEHFTWWDPPHGDFRPYRHQHDALFYALRKA